MSAGADGRGHERWSEDVAAYALGALDSAELPAFEEHLAGCTRCQNELAQMRAAAVKLPAAMTPAAPPPQLKQRVMTIVREEAAQQTAGAQQGRATTQRRRRPRVLRSFSWRAGLALAGAAAAALVVVVVLASQGGTRVRTFAGIVHAPGASASVRESGTSAQLRFAHLPAPPHGRIYEVWLQRKGSAPRPASVLFATTTGSVAVPASLKGVRTLLVTAEPRPHGSLSPTRSPIIVVPIA
jgi:anti-sigma-K factor RskA